jgi:hypothetical protein
MGLAGTVIVFPETYNVSRSISLFPVKVKTIIGKIELTGPFHDCSTTWMRRPHQLPRRFKVITCDIGFALTVA